MRKTTYWLVACCVLTSFTLGCFGGGTTTTTTVKPMEAYEQDAAKQITPDNADAELQKLMKDIDSDS